MEKKWKRNSLTVVIHPQHTTIAKLFKLGHHKTKKNKQAHFPTWHRAETVDTVQLMVIDAVKTFLDYS